MSVDEPFRIPSWIPLWRAVASVNLTKKVKVASKGLRFCPVVYAKNGRLRPDYVLVAGQEQHHPEGRYYIEWRENGRRARRAAGRDAAEADNTRKRQQAILDAKANGIQVLEKQKTGDRSVMNVVASYLDEIKARKKKKTYQAYKVALDYFLESCPKRTLDELDRSDLIRFLSFLRDTKQLSVRSQANIYVNVRTFLKREGIFVTLQKDDAPKPVEEIPEIYEREELDRFFAACSTEERMYFEFFFMTGMREQEVMHMTWKNVHLNRGVVTMRHNPEYGWTPKMYQDV